MIMRFSAFILLLVFTTLSYAQAGQLSAVNDFRGNQENIKPLQAGSTITTISSNSGTKIKGSIYLFDTWFNNAQVYFKAKNEPLILSKFNYNVQSKRFEFMTSKDSLYAIKSTNIDKVVVRNTTFVSRMDPNTRLISYYEEVFTSDDVTLLKKHDLGVKEGAVNQMTGKKLNPDLYIKTETYFLKESELYALQETKINKKLIAELVDKDDLSQIKKYAKDKHLSYRKEQDVKQMLQYAQSI